MPIGRRVALSCRDHGHVPRHDVDAAGVDVELLDECRLHERVTDDDASGCGILHSEQRVLEPLGQARLVRAHVVHLEHERLATGEQPQVQPVREIVQEHDVADVKRFVPQRSMPLP